MFDFAVVGIAVVPAGGAFAVLRALRVLRLVSLVPSMRRVIGALLKALPGTASIVGLLGLVLYVLAVMATKLYSAIAPEFFGTLGASLFTLFQIMTVEGWPDVARSVMTQSPHACLMWRAEWPARQCRRSVKPGRKSTAPLLSTLTPKESLKAELRFRYMPTVPTISPPAASGTTVPEPPDPSGVLEEAVLASTSPKSVLRASLPKGSSTATAKLKMFCRLLPAGCPTTVYPRFACVSS